MYTAFVGAQGFGPGWNALRLLLNEQTLAELLKADIVTSTSD
jgi:hypothetical protein